MPEATNDQLREAYDAIKANRLPEARRILDSYLKAKPNDADGWWLLTYAAADADEARGALNTVLRLDPAYPGARELSDELVRLGGRAAGSVPTSVRRLDPVGMSAPQPLKTTVSPVSQPKIDDDFDFDDELDERDEEAGGSSRRRLIFAASGFLLLILLVVLVFVFLPRLTNAPEPTVVVEVPTATPETPDSLVFGATTTAEDVSAEPTEDGSALVSATETSESPLSPTDTPDLASTLDTNLLPTDEAPVTTGDYAALYGALSAFDVVPDSISIEQTSVGATLAGTVCVGSAAALRDGIPNVMAALAGSSASLADDGSVQTLGARFTNCTDNTLLRYVGVSLADAQAFAAGNLTEQAFRAAFRVVTP
jgi:hypothetical protein